MIIIFCPETDKCTWHVCQIRVVEEIEGGIQQTVLYIILPKIDMYTYMINCNTCRTLSGFKWIHVEWTCIHEQDPDMSFLLSGKDGKDESSEDEDEDAESKKLREQLNSE